ncbi:unnamed protein product, partial [Polarella glacialis]
AQHQKLGKVLAKQYSQQQALEQQLAALQQMNQMSKPPRKKLTPLQSRHLSPEKPRSVMQDTPSPASLPDVDLGGPLDTWAEEPAEESMQNQASEENHGTDGFSQAFSDHGGEEAIRKEEAPMPSELQLPAGAEDEVLRWQQDVEQGEEQTVPIAQEPMPWGDCEAPWAHLEDPWEMDPPTWEQEPHPAEPESGRAPESSQADVEEEEVQK